MTEARHRYLAFAGIISLCALLYGYTLAYPFQFDDHVYLLENPIVTEGHNFAFLGDFQNFATYSKRLGLDPDLSVNFILRPVTYLTFYLNHAMDGWNPWGLRAVNIVIHCTNALLLFQLLSLLVRISPKYIPARERSAGFIALTGSLLFLVHPLGIESVTYIVQRFTSLATLFYLLVVLAYFRSSTADTVKAARAWRGISVAALVVGMLSKEILFTAPFLLVIIDHVVMGTSLKTAGKRAIPHFLCLPIIPVLMVMTSSALRSGGVSMESAMFVADPTRPSQYQYYYAITQFGVILTYLRMIFLPYGLNLDPDYPISESFWDFRVLASVTILITVVGSLGWLYIRRQNDLRWSLIICGAVWYFLGLSIDSSIVPLPDVMAEHRSYLPSIGVFLALACGADLVRGLWERQRRLKFLAPFAVAIWILALGAATTVRHQAWRSEIAMWNDVVKKSPKKPRAWMSLGAAYVREHRLKEAYNCYVEYLRLKPNHVVGYINLATVQADMGQYQEALNTASAGARFATPAYAYRLYYILGRVWLALGDVEKSIACAEQVVAFVPRHANTHRVLMSLYCKTAKYEKALHHGRIAVSMEPEDRALRSDVQLIEAEVAKHTAR